MPEGSRRVERLSHIMNGNNRRCLPDGRKGMQSPGNIEEENPCQSKEGALAWDRQLCLGQWQWTRRGWRQPQEIQPERKKSRRTSAIPQGARLGGAQRGSLWLCYAKAFG